MPKLFSAPDIKLLQETPIPETSTPLGSILLQATIGDFNSVSCKPSSVFGLENDGRLFSWQTEDFDLELLLCRPVFKVPNNVSDNCWAGIWRWSAKNQTHPSTLSCSWTPGYTWTRGGPDCGQFLYARLWDDEEYELCVSTEDDEKLIMNAGAGQGIPMRWIDQFQTNFYGSPVHYEYIPQDLSISLPDLSPDEHCQIKFVIVWKRTSADDTDFYNAQYLEASEILNSLNYK